MAKDNKENSDLSADDQALLDAIALEEKEAADKKAVLEAEAEEKAFVEPKADVNEPLNEKGEFKIIIIKDSPGLKRDATKVVSGNIANALIKKGIAELVEAMPEKSKVNTN